MKNADRIFIIGDIHGCLDPLTRMLDRIKWRPERDGLIFLGDYVDRGENSKGVIDLVMKIARLSPSVQCLMGNHESIFLEYLDTGNMTTFLFNGGEATLRSYRRGQSIRDGIEIPEDHVVFMRALKHWIELDDYYVVHAGFRPGVPLDEQAFKDLVWIRDPFIFSDYDFGKRVIFGHTPFPEPLVMENKIGLDTGAVYGNKLTCLELPDLQFHFVEA